MTPQQQQGMLDLGREALAQQAFSRLVGAELVALRPGHCELAVAVTGQLLQLHGFVHGGVLGYLGDNALAYAGGTAMRVPVVTSEYRINVLRPAQRGRLVARADTVHVGRQQSVCRCEVYVVEDEGRETLCAVAQGTIARLGDAPPSSGG